MTMTVSPPSSSANASTMWCITTCLLYGFGSGSMAFFNKALVSSLEFNYSNALLFFQTLACVILFQVFKALGYISFREWNAPLPSSLASTAARYGRWGFLVRLTPLSLFYLLNAACGMLSLQGLSLPMYSVLKRMTPLVVAAIEYWVFNRASTRMVVLSLGLCGGGFILAGVGDLMFDAYAYLLAISSCLSQALYLITVENSGKELNLNSHELLYYNSLISSVFLFPLLIYNGELYEAVFEYAFWDDPLFLMCFAAMLLLGMSLNYFMFLCTQVNSPLTTCMVGVIKGIATTLGGFFVFGGQAVTVLNLIGIAMNTSGGTLYAWAKYQEKEHQIALKKISQAPSLAAGTSSPKSPTGISVEMSHFNNHQSLGGDDAIDQDESRELLGNSK